MLLILFSGYGLANNACQPVVKEYQANPQATFKYRLANDLEFSTIQPKQMILAAGSTIFFNDERSRYMGYSLQYEEVNNSKNAKQALLEALNISPSTADTELFKYIFKNDNCQAVEVKTGNDLYKVYMMPIFDSKPDPYFSVYIVPNDNDKNFIHYLQFKGFTAEEVGQQLATINKGVKQ